MEITSLDLSVLEEELQELEEGFVQKVYQRNNELSIEIYVPGDEKKRLIIGTSYCYLSNYKRDNPERPPGFCMELRKKLGRIDNIYQKGFDRVLVIESGDVKLIAEMFGKGNLILVEEQKIIGALRQEEWADRDILVGEDFEFPEPVDDPREKDIIELLNEGELVKRLAIDLSLGGTYAEEICERTGIDKDTEVNKLSNDQREQISETVEKIIKESNNPKPVLYTEELPQRAAPFELETYRDYDKEHTDSFSEALDEYFYRRQKQEKERQKEQKYQEQKEGLERQLQQQEMKIKGLKESAKESREKAEQIYEDYSILDKIKRTVERGLEKEGWKNTEQKIRESDEKLTDKVKDFNEQERFYIVSSGDYNIKLKPEENLEAAASRYYDKAKQSESKIKNAKKALDKTKEKIQDLEQKEKSEIETGFKDEKKDRDKKWFEKYRWFYSSEDYLVLVGRDSQTNEMLVKKHMDPEDLYLHADFDGAPSVVIKKGQEAGDKTIEEAAKAAVTFSKTWKAGITSDDVYYVDPDQVTKNPESGEYLGTGAFVIRGDRDYIRNVSIEAFIGAYEIEDDIFVPMSGPENAVQKHSETVLELEPGRNKKSGIAKKIRGIIKDKEDVDLDLDYIIRSLPPGKSNLKR